MAQGAEAGMACAQAGRMAEQAVALPRNLLVSIGLVESGRLDPATGQVAAWPWTVNVDGDGHYFDNAAEAASFAGLALAGGARDVDIGCFQISLEQHKEAFTSLQAALDPATNAKFAAGFLNSLRARSGSWQAAIADYHSALPVFGLPYQYRVLAAWRNLGNPAANALPSPEAPDLSIIMEGPAARSVRVITPDEGPGLAISVAAPRVIVP